jgi:hypothetical protein
MGSAIVHSEVHTLAGAVPAIVHDCGPAPQLKIST